MRLIPLTRSFIMFIRVKSCDPSQISHTTIVPSSRLQTSYRGGGYCFFDVDEGKTINDNTQNLVRYMLSSNLEKSVVGIPIHVHVCLNMKWAIYCIKFGDVFGDIDSLKGFNNASPSSAKGTNNKGLVRIICIKETGKWMIENAGRYRQSNLEKKLCLDLGKSHYGQYGTNTTLVNLEHT
ncbi:hypothetical protein Lser_V15G37310 [Lactuca serriola]